MKIGDADTLVEVTAAFHPCEAALQRNDVTALDAMFVGSDRTVRYGVADVQYGIDEVRRFRAMQKPFRRRLSRTGNTAPGPDVADAATLFHRDDFPGQTGRQTQVWVRTADGWQVAAAHVNRMDDL